MRKPFRWITLLVLAFAFVGCSGQKKEPVYEVLYDILEDEGIEKALASYHELRQNAPDQYDFNLDQLQSLGHYLFTERRTEAGIAFLELNAEIFPDSAVVYYDLAKVYHHAGPRSLAVRNIRQSLALDSLRLATVILYKRMFFVPDSFDVPIRLETERFCIRPLTADDVDLDYAAIMSSLSHLKGVFGRDDWPPLSLTRAENLRSIKMHEEEYSRRQGFTYTVLTLDERECLGCVYIYPSRWDDYDAEAVLWVTTRAWDDGLDQVLFETVDKWLKEIWPFQKIVYPGRTVSWRDFFSRLDEQDRKYH